MEKLKKNILDKSDLTGEEFAKTLKRSQVENISLFQSFSKYSQVDENILLSIFADYYKINSIKIDQANIDNAIINIIPRDLAVKYNVLPIEKMGQHLILATSNPKDLKAIDDVSAKANCNITLVLAHEKKIKNIINKVFGSIDMSNLKDLKKSKKNVLDAKRMIIEEQPGDKKNDPVIQLVNDVLVTCINKGASDIHIEPYEEFIRIRLRVDGFLVEIAKPPINMKGALVSRIKIMSGLNIAENRLPQDGAINLTVEKKPIDFRVNTLPTMYGEKIVLRLLDKSNLQVDMTELGFESEQLQLFKKSINSPNGMVLVTGPTGSGKTTTLYSALQELNTEFANIMTAEDPVEYNLTGINQLQVKNDIGLNFASALRAFLRQDPDIIMVGEVRDIETAEISIKASLTGHMVLSTVHTNSASDTIARLLNMGVAPFNLVGALNCITAQRLVRKLCKNCTTEDKSISDTMLIEAGIPEKLINKIKIFKGRGCDDCNQSGYSGRIAVHEVMVINDKIKNCILKNESVLEIKKIAIQSGMKTLRQSALIKMLRGVTSFSEVLKATASDRSRNN